MVRSDQLKNHVQCHQKTGRYECADCKKVFSYLATYQAHFKYSRQHATNKVFKFPCPRCNKGYPTKQAMVDHFNYNHLAKTTHKCPICNKPIASQLHVGRHMMRVHSEKKAKPKNYVCKQCGKSFTNRRILDEHERVHTGERPLCCDICGETFRHSAAMYTHKRRVHKVPLKSKIVFISDEKS